jgi:hypothetical protein
MGAIDGSTLCFDDGTLTGGAAFRLKDSSPCDFNWTSTTGNKCVLKENSRWLTVERTSVLLSLEEHAESTHTDAQAALDILAIDQKWFLSMPSAHNQNIMWNRSPDGIILRLTSSIEMQMRYSISMTLKSADGTVQPLPVYPLPNWHEAMRYFRYSQLRNDLYVAYREAFLALESLFSTISAQNPGEREIDWLVRVTRLLENKYTELSFDDLVPISSTDKPRDFISEQFKAYRSALNHAKLNKPHLLPGNLGERKSVVIALRKLSRFLLQAMRFVLAPNVTNSVVTLTGYKWTIDRFCSELVLAVSPNRTPALSEDISIAPAGDVITDLTTTFEGVSDGYGAEFSFVGTIPVASMRSSEISTIAGHIPNGLIFRRNIENLNVTGATTFQIRLLYSFSQPSEFRSAFEL